VLGSGGSVVDERRTGEKRTGWWSTLLKSDVVARGREEKGGVGVGRFAWRWEKEERGGLAR
jgi:hypothetical protein